MFKKGGNNSDFDLQYVAPLSLNNKKVVVMKEAVSNRTEEKWSNAIIAYVFENRSNYHHFMDFIRRTWNPKGDFQVYTTLMTATKQSMADHTLSMGDLSF